MIDYEGRDWYKGFPTTTSNLPWCEYMIRHQLGGAQSFVVHADGISEHEVAHLLACKDEHVLDPYWGFPFKAESPFDKPGFATLEAFWDEVQVLSVQAVIIAFEDDTLESLSQLVPSILGSKTLAHHRVKWEHVEDAARKHLEGIVGTSWVEDELARKRALVQKLMN